MSNYSPSPTEKAYLFCCFFRFGAWQCRHLETWLSQARQTGLLESGSEQMSPSLQRRKEKVDWKAYLRATSQYASHRLDLITFVPLTYLSSIAFVTQTKAVSSAFIEHRLSTRLPCLIFGCISKGGWSAASG